MLRRLAQLAVPRLADWCAIDLWENGMIRNVGVAHVDPAKVELAHELQKRFPPDPDSPRGVANVLRTGRSELTPEIPDVLIDEATTDPNVRQILRDLGLHSAIVAPLSAHGETLGALTLISAEQRRTYTSDDLILAEDLGSPSGAFDQQRATVSRADRDQQRTAAEPDTRHAAQPGRRRGRCRLHAGRRGQRGGRRLLRRLEARARRIRCRHRRRPGQGTAGGGVDEPRTTHDARRCSTRTSPADVLRLLTTPPFEATSRSSAPPSI